jgi:hypothetical protein
MIREKMRVKKVRMMEMSIIILKVTFLRGRYLVGRRSRCKNLARARVYPSLHH